MIYYEKVVFDCKAKHCVDVGHEGVEEYHEMDVVLYAHAVVYPGTMVVETFHTFVANSTVFGSRCSYNQAVGAQLNWID